jgi:hypothetical protein
VVRIVDDDRRAKRFRFTWSLTFHPDAKVLDASQADELIRSGRETAELMAAHLQSRTAPRN